MSNMYSQKLKKNTKGITLISLAVTVIILIIIAGISINVLIGKNGILTKAQETKQLNDLTAIIEKLKLDVYSLTHKVDGTPIYMTVSEIVDKLKEKGTLNDDMTFCDNSEYALRYVGDIVYKNEIVSNVKLSDNIKSLKIDSLKGLNQYLLGSREYSCYDGEIDHGENERIIIRENGVPKGKKFAYWVDKYNNIVSYENDFALTTIDNNTYVPIYVDEDILINPKFIININSTKETEDGYLVFESQFYPIASVSSMTIGTLGTSNKELANTEDLVATTTNSQIYNRSSSDFLLTNGMFIWTKSNVGDLTWYCRGYAIVTYTDNTTETIYTDIISQHK